MNRESFNPDRVGSGADRSASSLDAQLESLARETIGAAIEVHQYLGPGFPESVYENAMHLELDDRGLNSETQVPIKVSYKGRPVGEGRADLLIENRLIVELKTVEALSRVHTAQVIGYLRAKELRLGLLINFHCKILKEGIQRVIL